MLAVGEDVLLARQVGATGIHQIEAGQAILQGDGLGAQVLLHRQRIIGAALNRGVVGNDHALDALDAADAGHYPGRRYLFLINVEGCQGADFQKGRTGVQQLVDALAGQQLAAAGMARLGLGAAAFTDARQELVEPGQLLGHGGGVALVVRGAAVQGGGQHGHGGLLTGFR